MPRLRCAHQPGSAALVSCVPLACELTTSLLPHQTRRHRHSSRSGKLYWEGPKSNNAFDYFTHVFDGFSATKGDAYVARSERLEAAGSL